MANVSNDALIREVDEELRRDRMHKFWRNFGPFVIGGAVLVVLVVAGYEGWTWWQKTNSSKYSDQFYAATEIAAGKDLVAAKAALDGVIADGSRGYAMLAQFREAALLSANGKLDEAVAAYDALATNQSNPHIRNLALVLGANLLIDKGDVAAVNQRVAGLLGPDAPLHSAAREILGLTQYKSGDLNTAIATLQQVAEDPAASRDVRARVNVYIAQMESEGGKTKDQLAQATAPAVAAPAASDTVAPATATPAPATDLSVAPAADASSALDAGALLDMAAPAVDGAAAGVDADTSLDVTAPADVTPALPETASSAASSAPAN